MPLTRSDVGSGPAHHVVGERPDGSTLIYGSFATAEKAWRLHDRLYAHLEGVTLRVEREALPPGKGRGPSTHPEAVKSRRRRAMG